MVLVWSACGFIAGVLLGSKFTLAPPLLIGIGVVAAGMMGLLWRFEPARLGLLVLSALVFGMVRGQSLVLHFGPHDLASYNGSVVDLSGIVSADPDVRDTGINYVVSISRITRVHGDAAVSGLVEVHTSPSQILEEGDEVQLTGMLQTPVNSGAVPYRTILANRGIFSEMSFPQALVTGHSSLGLLSWADDVRGAIERRISSSMSEPEAGLLLGILIGARTAQLGTLAPVLIRTGLIHLIAVSGVKIAIVSGVVSHFLRRKLSRLPVLLISSSVLLSYWMVSGATVAGLRASIMWLLVFLATYLGRPTFAPVSLAVAVSLMVAGDPRLLWDDGFQLTVLGTAGIVAFTPLLDKLTSRLPSAVSASLTTTTAAQVAVLPVQIAGFHIVSPVSLLTNALVLPLLPFTMLSGFVLALVPVAPVAAVSYGMTHMIVLVANWASGVPGSAYHVQSVPGVLTAAYYGALLLAAAAIWRLRVSQTQPARGEMTVGLSVAVLALALTLAPHTQANEIRGLARGSILVSAGGRNILIDGGSLPSLLLERLGRDLPLDDRRLDAIIDTEPSASNLISLLGVARDIPVARVLDPGIEYPSQTYARWRAWLRANNVPVLSLRPGIAVHVPGVTIRVLDPDAVYPNPKDGAGILLISMGHSRLLYVGEASATEQEDLPFRHHVRAALAISAVPVNDTLRHAFGIRRVVRPTAGLDITIR